MAYRNNNAYCFTSSSMHDVNKITEPLFSSFKISFFECFRIFDNGCYMRLMTGQANYAQHYFANVHDNGNTFTEAIQKTPHDSEFFYLWPTQPLEMHFELLHAIDLVHGISVFQRGKNYIDAYVFATSGRNHGVQNFFMNERDILKDFIKYFKLQAQNLLDYDKNKLAKYKNTIDIKYRNKHEIFEQKNKLDFYSKTKSQCIVQLNNQYLTLTHRESECLSYYSQGKTMKEIAALLRISPRTVETYIDHIRQKTGCLRKAEMRKLL